MGEGAPIGHEDNQRLTGATRCDSHGEAHESPCTGGHEEAQPPARESGELVHLWAQR